ncbi:MAG: hypothetical protein A2583_02575 [Bdellovibrionales bacterium RIFOXYD1_FULL_53_11]|nr:MAG: hypothetical protein A2583_02575 [Bdellovibrionales bacterium RIFOXYD1_FULL_53_11]
MKYNTEYRDKLDRIRRGIIGDAETSKKTVLADAEEKKRSLIETGKAQAETTLKESATRLHADISRETMRRMAAIELEQSMRKLKAKAALMERASEDARTAVADIRNSGNYPDFLKALILEAVLSLKEDDVWVLFDHADDKIITKDLLSSIEIILTFTYNMVIKLDIPEERIKTSGGIIVKAKNKNVLCNNTFDERMELYEGTFRQQVNTELFR